MGIFEDFAKDNGIYRHLTKEDEIDNHLVGEIFLV